MPQPPDPPWETDSWDDDAWGAATWGPFALVAGGSLLLLGAGSVVWWLIT